MTVRREALAGLIAVVGRRQRVEAAIARSRLVGADRRLLHELVYGTLRCWWRLRADWRRFVRDEPPLPAACALAMGLYQLREMGTPPHAAIGETVAAVKARAARLAGLVNAVLRRAAVCSPPVQAVNLPPWVWRRWSRVFGEAQARAIGEAFARRPRVALRLFVPRDAWLVEARRAGIDAHAGGRPDEAWLDPPVRIEALPGYREGAFVVLDPGSAAVVDAFDPPVRGRIAELCAAPGGKTALLAHRLPRAQRVAVEIDRARIERLRQNLARLRVDAAIVQGDATRAPLRAAAFDGVLLDAPCSASGVARRRPDVWFRHRREDLDRLARTQRAMLEEALRLVRPGGCVVYAVCSLHPEETDAVVDGLPGLIEKRRIWPTEANDGFFIARFARLRGVG